MLSLRYGCECNNLMHVEKIPLVSTFDILFTERMKIRLRVWQGILLQNSLNEDRASTSSQQQFQTAFYILRSAILLNGFTPHQLRLIKLVIPISFFSLSCSLPFAHRHIRILQSNLLQMAHLRVLLFPFMCVLRRCNSIFFRLLVSILKI